MRTYDINTLSVSTLLKSELLNKKGSLILSAFLCFTCIFTGIFFSFCLPAADQVQLFRPINNLLVSEDTAVMPSLVMNLFLLILIYLSGLSLYGFPAALFIISGKSLALGFCAGLIYCSEMPHLLISLASSNIFIIISFLLAAFLSLNYALYNIASRAADRHFRNEYTILFSIPIILAVLSAFVDGIFQRLF